MSEKQSTDDLLASRKAVYGDRVQNMIDIAGIWSILLGVTIQPWQVPLMMDAVKQHRQFRTPDYGDTADDREGWFKIFKEVMGDDLIEARTVEEYHEKKALREKGVAEIGAGMLARTSRNLVMHEVPLQKKEEGSGNPYANVHLDEELDALQKKEGSGNSYANVYYPDPVVGFTTPRQSIDGRPRIEG